MSDTHTGPAVTLANGSDPSNVVTPEADLRAAEDDTEPETYPADVVRKLRDENAKFRTRSKDAEQRVDALSRELFELKVSALDKLADVTDLPYNADLLDDPDALASAVEDLIAKRPHYAQRPRPTGSVGQGTRRGTAPTPTFGSLLR
jgi:multidrug efflux pump subunit AcrA (membrane-fusion protein)